MLKELKKIVRVIKKIIPEAPHHTMLCIDATTGQNAYNQVEVFSEAVGLDGIILTKLDGTAKGGVAYPIVKELEVPIVFTGFGETINDLSKFNVEEFVDKILM